MKKLLILGAGISQVPIIRKAKASGFYTVVVDYNPEAPGIKFADKFLEVSTNDKEAVLKAVKSDKIDCILTTSDYPVNVVAYVGKETGLPAMSESVARICTDKYLQRSLFREKGIKTPYFKLCLQDEDLSAYKEFPYMVKPCDSSASRGVRKVDNEADLREAFSDALSNSRSGKVLIESFIEGREFSVEGLSQDGVTHIVTITEKLTKGEELGYFVEDTHIEPARITPGEWSEIESEVLKAAEAIGFDNCPSHTEVKLNSKGAWIIETACRLGGDYITSDLVPLSTGVDMMDNLIRISMGEKIDVEKKISKVSAVQFLNQDNYDDCVSFIASSPSAMVRSEVEPRHHNVVKSSMDRMGYMIFQFENYSELDAVMAETKR